MVIADSENKNKKIENSRLHYYVHVAMYGDL